MFEDTMGGKYGKDVRGSIEVVVIQATQLLVGTNIMLPLYSPSVPVTETRKGAGVSLLQ